MEGLRTCVFLVVGCVLQGIAQSGSPLRSHAAPEYVFGPGDQILIHVADVDDMPTTALHVDPNGFIDLPLAGRVQAAGVTSEQLKHLLEARYRRFLTTPDISVNLSESSSQPVSVVGEVVHPGVQQLNGARRLLEVLSLFGGLKPEAGSKVIITRDPRWGHIDLPGATLDANGFTTVTLPLEGVLNGSSPENNIPIEPHDVISVPRADLVYVLGDVHKPGGFALTTHPGMSVLHALSMAEGLSPDSSPGGARILRPFPGGDGGMHQIPVNVSKITEGKAPDVQLLPNDVLFVPHSGMKVASRRAVEAALGVTTGILIYR